jgi:hypothetical protein
MRDRVPRSSCHTKRRQATRTKTSPARNQNVVTSKRPSPRLVFGKRSLRLDEIWLLVVEPG